MKQSTDKDDHLKRQSPALLCFIFNGLEEKEMIRYKDKVFEEYFINPETAEITDKDGIIQEIKVYYGRPRFKRNGCSPYSGSYSMGL